MDGFCQTITKRTIVVIDTAPINRSKKFLAKIEQWREEDLWIYFLAPYSPELNIIEVLWCFIKYNWLSFDAFINFKNIKERVIKVLDYIDSKYCIDFY